MIISPEIMKLGYRFRDWISKLATGFSNEYWGWGGEDDDLFKRLHHTFVRTRIINRETDEHYNWHMVSHQKAHGEEGNPVNPQRFRLKKHATNRMQRDGLNNLQFTVLHSDRTALYEKLTVNIGTNSTNQIPIWILLRANREETYIDSIIKIFIVRLRVVSVFSG